MTKTKDYEGMTVGEFIETELFKEHLEKLLNDLLHGYNNLTLEKQKGTRFRRAPLVNMLEEGLLDNTEAFKEEFRKAISYSSSRSSSERQCIISIGTDAIHSALASLTQNKNGKKS